MDDLKNKGISQNISVNGDEMPLALHINRIENSLKYILNQFDQFNFRIGNNSNR